MNNLVEMLSKLNPMAQEFVPPSLAANNHGVDRIGYTRNFGMFGNFFDGNGDSEGKPNFNQGRRRTNGRRTVYVADIDQQVTEEQLAGLFIHCGQVVDCRICGDPNSVLRFAFVEFTDEEGAIAALSLSGTVLGYYPLKVLPSKTAIAPVNPTFLPRSEDEREMCARTVYCTNIDKKVNLGDVRLFFESSCGEVRRLRLLGDYRHSTRIAFVEFAVVNTLQRQNVCLLCFFCLPFKICDARICCLSTQSSYCTLECYPSGHFQTVCTRECYPFCHLHIIDVLEFKI
ncbi:unnamed protein product [Linum tenue]|uniref:RRM domain-containing protein n=1 Tax=Linum tenue TaxID=586396 RepID=A0AAV0IJ22_9ROSI|nr:unnamed protein product [Linum tenue]